MAPEEFEGRIVSAYERSLSTTVNDIEHIESQTLNGMSVVKIFFQPNVNINAAICSGHCDLANRAQTDASRDHPAFGDELQRLHRFPSCSFLCPARLFPSKN